MLRNFDEITLIPAKTSRVYSRSICDTTYTGGYLPIFVSPMACLTDMNNDQVFNELGFNVIIPRTVEWKDRLWKIGQGCWVAVGFKEAQYLYKCWKNVHDEHGQLDFIPHICIDQAQGHLVKLLELCKQFKLLLGRDGIQIMTGNIANPFTYYEYAIHGIDYVRCSVGTGHGCTTSCQTGFHYPMGSLITDINKIKQDVQHDILSAPLSDNCIYTLPKVVADGGFHTNAQIIKALALGADYVMLGEIIAKSEEACGHKREAVMDVGIRKFTYGKWERAYYGMSTERAQKEINDASMDPDKNFQPKRSEGIEKYVLIEYSIKDWLNDFQTDLKSAMSYADAVNLNQFVGKVEWDFISHDSYMKFMGKLQ